MPFVDLILFAEHISTVDDEYAVAQGSRIFGWHSSAFHEKILSQCINKCSVVLMFTIGIFIKLIFPGHAWRRERYILFDYIESENN